MASNCYALKLYTMLIAIVVSQTLTERLLMCSDTVGTVASGGIESGLYRYLTVSYESSCLTRGGNKMNNDSAW